MADFKLNTAVLVDKLRARFSAEIVETKVAKGEVTHLIKKDALIGVLTFVKGESDFQMDYLADVVGVDFHPEEPRFEVVYHLLSTKRNLRLRIKVRAQDGEEVPTVTTIWSSANFAEREIYDMFGIKFTGHPDMRRIYLAHDWVGHPLRKDYPLRGFKDKYNPNGEEKK